MKTVFIVFAITLLSITACFAEEPRTVGVYKRHMLVDSQQKLDFDHTLHHILYLTGMSDAYAIINKQKQAEKQKLLYCQPDTEILNGVDYMKILQKALDSPDNSIADQLTVAEAMLLALQKEFPCQ